MRSRFEILRGRTGLYRFRLIAANGEVIAPSQRYKTKAGARKGIAAVMRATHDIDAWGTKTVDRTVRR